QDMVVLNSLAANKSVIQYIFFYPGGLIALIGSIVGGALGVGFCGLQEKYGFVHPNEGSLFDAYPVDMSYSDILIIFLTVLLVSIIVSYVASKLSIKGFKKVEELDSN